MAKKYIKVIYHLLKRYRLRNLIKSVFERLGYKLVGFHYIYLRKVPSPCVVEFIGLAGKTHLLKHIVELNDFKRVKPIVKHELNYNDLSDETKFIISEIFSVNVELSYSTRLSLLNKLILFQNYNNFIQMWDEGFVKESLIFVLDLIDKFPNLMANFFAGHKFVIVLPPIDKIVNRYYKRDKPLITYDKYYLLRSKMFFQQKSSLESFIKFCIAYEIDHLVIQGEDSDIHSVKEFVLGKIHDQKS